MNSDDEKTLEILRNLLAGEGPITLTFGEASIFPASESRNSDVLKIDVESPDLERLNAKIKAVLPHTTTHPQYHPHATVAYLKPGMGQKYAGPMALTGKTVTVDSVTFSGKDNTRTTISLIAGKSMDNVSSEGSLADGGAAVAEDEAKAAPAGECCPSCGARQERSDEGTCNRCHKPWPMTKDDDDEPETKAKAVVEFSGALPIAAGHILHRSVAAAVDVECDAGRDSGGAAAAKDDGCSAAQLHRTTTPDGVLSKAAHLIGHHEPYDPQHAGAPPESDALEAKLIAIFRQQRAEVLAKLPAIAARAEAKSWDNLSIEGQKAMAEVLDPNSDAGRPSSPSGIAAEATSLAEIQKRRGDTKAIEEAGIVTKAARRRWAGFDAEGMADDVRPVIEVSMRAGAKRTAARLGLAEVPKVVNPEIPDQARKLALKFCESTNDSTTMRLDKALAYLRESLAQGLEQGEATRQLTDRVEQIFDEAETSRAKLIAQTESSRATHAGDLMTAVKSGVVKAKAWLASADACDRCDEHAAKGEIDLGDTFGEDDYGPIYHPPGHPRCQCSLRMVLKSGDELDTDE